MDGRNTTNHTGHDHTGYAGARSTATAGSVEHHNPSPGSSPRMTRTPVAAGRAASALARGQFPPTFSPSEEFEEGSMAAVGTSPVAATDVALSGDGTSPAQRGGAPNLQTTPAAPQERRRRASERGQASGEASMSVPRPSRPSAPSGESAKQLYSMEDLLTPVVRASVVGAQQAGATDSKPDDDTRAHRGAQPAGDVTGQLPSSTPRTPQTGTMTAVAEYMHQSPEAESMELRTNDRAVHYRVPDADIRAPNCVRRCCAWLSGMFGRRSQAQRRVMPHGPAVRGPQSSK